MTERCDWNPFLDEPSKEPADPTDCYRPAEWSVGTGKNNWHLCGECMLLPRFRTLRKRVFMGDKW